MTKTIEQLTARVRELEEQYELAANLANTSMDRVRELEEENARLHKQVDLQMPAIAFKQLTEQLAAAQEEMNGWRNQAHQSQSACDRLQDQLAKAEQRVAEACATACDGWCYGMMGQRLREGEWRKFVKG